ncbi:amidoligase family protein [Sneathiella litorea]|uniref:Amidoligase enzyme n=1 Tax=Sneathiella litorea TaxID=2606216 RepID=A0A6L8W9B0_9PROT|nr:amidoligase family protein [Sneathiella litorea]MZR31701.1 amidoligase enzyme [Sneathiella litorea]
MRRVGVEIEFSGLDPANAAQLLADIYDGQVVATSSAFVFSVEGTPWGKFLVELDTQYVNPEKDLGDLMEEAELPLNQDAVNIGRDLDSFFRNVIGKVSSIAVPTEIVAPPIPWNELDKLTALVEGLRENGAKGTDDNFIYAFGVHLNPEVAADDVGYLLRHLRAYVLLSHWLRDRIEIDTTRRLLPHVDPFPREYVRLILDADYSPDLETLISDYARLNPTRNRELDMFPLFKFLAPDVVARFTDDILIKARPTFHYRLPNTHLSDPAWDIVAEWNRWFVVEKLAADEKAIQRLSDRYLAKPSSFVEQWIRDIGEWIETL